MKSVLILLIILQMMLHAAGPVSPNPPPPKKDLPLPGEVFLVAGRTAFIIPAKNNPAAKAKPWVWYAPTLLGLPGKEEQWMFEQFLDAGIAVAGIDAGESYGSPAGNKLFTAFHTEMTEARGYGKKPVLLGRSRGGLMTLSWAATNPDKVAAFAGIYPVCNVASYPGVANAAGAFQMKPEELQAHLTEYNPIDRLAPLAKAGVPFFAIHGDVDKVVPLEKNSGLMKERYTALGGTMQLVIPPGQGHNMWTGFFQCQELVDFVKAQAGKTAAATAPLKVDRRDAANSDRAGLAFFENRIRPLLAENCYECHSAKAKKLKGGLRLDDRDAFWKGGDSGVAIVPGDPERSLLIKAVRHTEKDLAMPPSKDGSKKLPEAAIAGLVDWVKMGAPFPASEFSNSKSPTANTSHWSFQPVQNPPAPAVKKTDWPRNSLDRFILARLEAKGGQPAPAADRRTLLRRATFDLTGLPPTPEDIDAFVADKSSDAFAKVVERLLSSPRYGERWGRHWLDVVRYADTAGDTADYPVPEAWRYRNYVIDAFNADKPYDEFLREQIAGDILARQGPRERYAERVTATGYLAISRRFGFDSENYHHLTIQDTIDTLGQSVLGLTLGCARCHNHKFDPVTSTEYYGLYGIFESTRYAFPGSEQKQKYRALASLAPVEESQVKWREFESRFAALGQRPGAVLRSLDDLDGDFEMQRAAAGGSKGVLVLPWLYAGKISVSPDAQSPFKNLYPFGGVGVQVPAGASEYWLRQALHPSRSRGLIHVNLDFRAANKDAAARGQHRFWIGAQGAAPAVEVFISSDAVSFPVGDHQENIRLPKPGQWHNLQLTLDLNTRTFSGSVGVPGEVTTIQKKPFAAAWTGAVNFLAFDASGSSNAALPGLDLDNIAVQETAIPPVATSPATLATAQDPNLPALTAQLEALAGIDGDFELQKDGAPPAKPWHPGPKSAVKISAAAQSPHRNIYPAGSLGISMPNSGDYNGFGQTLPKPWKPGSAERLFVSFDFRCASVTAGGGGSWRYYLGHGAGTSAAVELFFNGTEFFRRSGDVKETVRPIKVGEWHQVQLALNLKEKKYAGSIVSTNGRTEFEGQFASGWDGSIDYTFIDSYGHLAGVKPALDADNFVIRETPLPPLDAPPSQIAGEPRESRLAKISELRRQLEQASGGQEKRKQELNAQLISGPLELAYGVAEGTPHNARLQLRGEPDKPGDEVPRGFLKILGGTTLPVEHTGSGRLELAQWLTRPENPLTARVMVNRLWQYHFGQGLVKTPNDFGTRGQPPTHPELLDHLATQFIRGGWSIKSMHRLILLSATYQQSGAVTGPATEDTFNPFPRRRLGAEELRDAILFVSGELDVTPGRSHPFPAATSWGFTQHGPFSAVYDHRQRSVYLMAQRLKRHPFLALFDGADPNSSTPDRRTTTVPTQALYFLNDPFVHAQSEKFAARWPSAGTDETRRIDLAYRLAFGRLPGENERAAAKEFLASYRAEFPAAQKDRAEAAAQAAFARVLFGCNEFLGVD